MGGVRVFHRDDLPLTSILSPFGSELMVEDHAGERKFSFPLSDYGEG